MDVITNSYDSISTTQLYSKISQKYAELDKIDQEEQLEQATKLKQDYIETSSVGKNYDEDDYARVLAKFRNKDASIKSHEQSHAAMATTTSPISYNYQEGPDGKMYAVGGSVRLDTSIPADTEAAIAKIDRIKAASTGVDNPSGADMAIASAANLNKILLQLRGDEDAN